MINSSNTLTTVHEQAVDLNDTIGALNRDNALSSFQRVPELGMTAKRDDDRAMMTSLMRQQEQANPVSSSVETTEVYNPFSQNTMMEVVSQERDDRSEIIYPPGAEDSKSQELE